MQDSVQHAWNGGQAGERCDELLPKQCIFAHEQVDLLCSFLFHLFLFGYCFNSRSPAVCKKNEAMGLDIWRNHRRNFHIHHAF